ncbi:MAG: methyltransferase type 11 [uncultured bacterium (gcode 4)]|uniref:Methyltransferase type 11 n=1 Tax=uncultured bacterium (gcode 4) TaxID=1234023 RepID=K2BVG0_9BACT|nr:MAG: methyltransferase type 11 [uncultured bacterium (gcode 4)]
MNNCFICNWKSNYYLTSNDIWYHTIKKDYNVYKCNKCWVETIYPMPDYEEILSFYPKDIYHSFNTDKLNETIFDKIIKLWFKNKMIWRILNRWKMWIPFTINGTTFLDIWCWDWNMLKLMNKYWWKSYWFELWDKNFLNNIFYDNQINNVDFWNLKFDFIRISHVFEHLPNPLEFLEKLKSISNKDTIIDIMLPNTKSFSANIFWKYWCGRDIPRHLINYNIENLSLFLENNWFKILNKRFLLSYWVQWSLLYYVKFKMKNNFLYKLFDSKLFKIVFISLDLLLILFHYWDQIWFRVKIKV